MKILSHPAFLICAGLFLVHQLLQKGFSFSFPFLDSYLDPLLCMPILLTLFLAERRWLFLKGEGYVLQKGEVVGIVLTLTLLFEWGFPLFSDKFTADWRDAVAYAVGGMFFYNVLNKS